MERRARSIGFLPAHTTSDGTQKGGKSRGRGGQSVRRRRERWREYWENRQTGHRGGRRGSDSIDKTRQSIPMRLSPCHGALAPEATMPFTSGHWGHSQPRSRMSISQNCRTDTYLRSSPRAGRGRTCEGLSARYGPWRTWGGSLGWSRPGIGAWRSPPSATRRSSDRMEDWRHCPYLPNPVEQRSSGPGSPWPSSPSSVCGGWGRRPGFDDEGWRTRLYGSDATRTVTRLFSENWARTPQNG